MLLSSIAALVRKKKVFTSNKYQNKNKIPEGEVPGNQSALKGLGGVLGGRGPDGVGNDLEATDRHIPSSLASCRGAAVSVSASRLNLAPTSTCIHFQTQTRQPLISKSGRLSKPSSSSIASLRIEYTLVNLPFQHHVYRSSPTFDA